MAAPGTPERPLQTRTVDDKSPVCIPFILAQLDAHRRRNPARPFVIGLNGVQGVGKTTLVRALASTLQSREGVATLVVSIDDFYLTHADQLELAAAHPANALVQVRGEPGTHDTALLRAFFSSLLAGQPTHVPQYDKSAFSGLGDRVPASRWPLVNVPGERPVQVLILEGWCVGFRALNPATVAEKWRSPSKSLHSHMLEHLLFINEKLLEYDFVTDHFDAFIHIDAADLDCVYDWRREQEEELRREYGNGMTDEQVLRFVSAYYPAYELFLDKLRNGMFHDKPGCQLRLVVDKFRMVEEKVVI